MLCAMNAEGKFETKAASGGCLRKYCKEVDLFQRQRSCSVCCLGKFFKTNSLLQCLPYRATDRIHILLESP